MATIPAMPPVTGSGLSLTNFLSSWATVRVGVGAGVGSGGNVGGGPGIAVGVLVGVSSLVGVGVSVGISDGVSVGMSVGVSVGVGNGVSVGVGEGASVGDDGVPVGMRVEIASVGDTVIVDVGISGTLVGEGVKVRVEVGVSVGWMWPIPAHWLISNGGISCAMAMPANSRVASSVAVTMAIWVIRRVLGMAFLLRIFTLGALGLKERARTVNHPLLGRAAELNLAYHPSPVNKVSDG